MLCSLFLNLGVMTSSPQSPRLRSWIRSHKQTLKFRVHVCLDCIQSITEAQHESLKLGHDLTMISEAVDIMQKTDLNCLLFKNKKWIWLNGADGIFQLWQTLPPVFPSNLIRFDRKAKGQRSACHSVRPPTRHTAFNHSNVEDKGQEEEDMSSSTLLHWHCQA